MEEFYKRIYSKDFTEAANFYKYVFGGEEPKLMYGNGQASYMCMLFDNYQVQVIEASFKHTAKVLEFSVSNPESVRRRLVSHKIKFDCIDKNTFAAEDLNGNILCISYRKMIGVSMPKGTSGL